MIGHNRLLVAQEAGHSVSKMERAYAAWITGAKPEDIERIKAAMAKPTVDRKCWRGSHGQQTLEHSATGRYGLGIFIIVRLAIFLFLATSASSYAQDRLNWPGIFEASTAAMTSMPHCFQTKTPALV